VALELDETFEKLVEYLVAHEEEVSKSVPDKLPRPWMNFNSDDLKTKAEDKKETTLHDVLSRDDANEAYVKARENEEAKSNEVAVPKIAGDFLASLERDKRAQWRGRIRSVAHALSRRAGNGQDNGPLRRHTIDFVSRIMLKAEEKKPNG
jgi:predicted GNAT superfamily acetyltransferase